MCIRWKRNDKSLHCASLHINVQVIPALPNISSKYMLQHRGWDCTRFENTFAKWSPDIVYTRDTQPLHQRRMRSTVAILRHPRSATEALMQTPLLFHADVDVSAAALVISTRPPASVAITPSGQKIIINRELVPRSECLVTKNKVNHYLA